MADDHDRPELAAGGARLTLAPSVGGSIAAWRHGGLDLLRPAAAEERSPLGMACFPMVPFCGRIAGAAFAWRGRRHLLAPRWAGTPHAIHGTGWLRPWRVAVRNGSSVVLELDHEPARDGAAAWPFAFRATQHFMLAPDRLSVTIAVENRGREPAPAAVGLHPYFVRPPDTVLTARLARRWLTDATTLPTVAEPVPAGLDFSAGRRMEPVEVDACFDGWDGRATVAWPSRALAVDLAAAAPALVVFNRPDRPVLCVEPQTQVPDAINRPDMAPGMTLLAPGERLALALCLVLRQ